EGGERGGEVSGGGGGGGGGVGAGEVDESALTPVEHQDFCPYKGLCGYYDIGDVRMAAWSYRDAYLSESAGRRDYAGTIWQRLVPWGLLMEKTGEVLYDK